MTLNDGLKYQMLVRVSDFGAAHRDLFSPGSIAAKTFALIATVVDGLKRDDATELTGRGVEQKDAGSKAERRVALRRRLTAIRDTARSAAADVPGLDRQFDASIACSDERLLGLARSFLDAAKPVAKTFVAHEMPSNFLSQLQQAIDAFEQASSDRNASRSQRVAARARIADTVGKGVAAARRLDGIVPNKLRDPDAIALWNVARRVGYPKRRAKGAPEAAAPATSPAAPVTTSATA